MLDPVSGSFTSAATTSMFARTFPDTEDCLNERK